MKKIWKFLFLLMSTSVTAQNLVPNPSFEDTVACPVGIGDITQATGWDTYGQTPDYLNACNNNQAGVPANLFGYQNAKTGNAYAGFYSFNSSGFYREIIGVQLNQSLVIGEKYFVTFYVSRAINLSIAVRTGIATNKLGARFSTASFSYTNPIPIDNFSQVYTNSIIQDTLNWVKISGAFIADSAYNYLSIGNFFTDSATNIHLDSNAVNAYYYVDDICVSSDSLTYNNVENYVYESNRDSVISLFPNPSNGIFYIKSNSYSEVELSIYSITGELLIKKNLSGYKEYYIDMKNYPNGIYFPVIKIRDKLITKKIIKM